MAHMKSVGNAEVVDRKPKNKIKPPKPQDPKLSYGPRPQSMLGGVYKPSI